MADEKQQIEIDPVAGHFQRQANYFRNEALVLSDQVRELTRALEVAKQEINRLLKGE